MRALEAEQHAAAPTGNNGAEGPRRAQSPHQPSTREGPHRRRLYARRPWVIACALGAAVAALLAVGVTFGGGTTTRQQPSRSAASRTAAPTAGLIAAATEKFLAMEHAADRTLSPPRPRSPHARPSGVACPANATSRLNTRAVWIAIPEHDHIVNKRHIRSGRYHRAGQRTALQPGLDAPRRQDRVNDPPRPSRTPRPARTRARAPRAYPKRPSAHSSQEPAPAAANSPHARQRPQEGRRHVNTPDTKATGPATALRHLYAPLASLPLEHRGLPCAGCCGRVRRQLRARGDHEQRHDRRLRRQGQRRHAPRQAPALRAWPEPYRPQLGARPPDRERLGDSQR